MTVAPARQQTTQLLVIDQNINGWQDLANNAGIGVGVLILDPLQDGLMQIANAVTAYSNLDAIQILSHGSVASLQLGATTLNSNNLSQYTEQLSIIGDALGENGDLLLYGCNVAQGDTGQQFIEQLSVLTGADVAASTDLTGDANKGGDWVLETQTGTIEASSAISLQVQATYHNTLATTLGVFAATDVTNGKELWVTDGTAAGTSLLKDINVGNNNSNPQNITSLGNGKTVFVVNNQVSSNTYDVWVTDGTTAGTGNLLKNLGSVTYSDSLHFITLGNGKALFSSFNVGTLSTELWVTDGTVAGTNMLVVPSDFFSTGIVSIGNGKALIGVSSPSNQGLWISDGTTAGTSLVKAISNGSPNSSGQSSSINIAHITSLGNGSALFTATDTANGNELWISNGTTAGTGLLKDIVAGTNGSYSSSFTMLGNGKAVFTTGAQELWITDGTAAGTNVIIGGLGNFDSAPFSSSSFTSLGNGKVLFSTNLGLWVTDGTAVGTNLLGNIVIGKPMPYASVTLETYQMITSLGNGQALFSAYDSINGYELWISDGTTAGTHSVKDINAGINNSNPQFFTPLGNGKATFSATDASNGTELWITDGTAAGTSRLKDVNTDGDSSNPQFFTALGNGKVLFSAYNASNGKELWVTDGTAAGTGLVKDIFAGATSSDPQYFTSLGNGKGLFKTGFNDLILGNESLWVSDGTAAGTNLLKAGTGVSTEHHIISLNNGKAVFTFYTTISGNELWVTDGTTAGTSLVKDIVAGISDSNPTSFTTLGNGKVLFSIYNGINNQLWITDGTAAGTNLLKDIVIAGNGIFYPDAITSLGNGKALFSIYNSELWITDGTMAGTTQLIGANLNYAKYIASLGNGKAVFTNYDATNGNELWITDGTVAGTGLLKNINPGIAESFVQFITSIGNGKVLFHAYDASNGSKIWITDGTAAGTTIFAGTSGSSYLQLGNGNFIFSGNDATNGTELWITDGTAAGTHLVKDIVAGIGSSNPQSFTLLANGKVVFSAFDAVNGTELWITDGTAAGTGLVKDINTLMTQSSNPSAVTLMTGTNTNTNTNTNTAPNVLAGTTTVFTEQTPVTVAGKMTINDVNGDADWNGGKLQVQITANNTINDSLVLPTANNGGIWLNPAGNVLMANTTIIGTANATTVSNSSAWTFIFNASATNALVQSTARTIQFINNSDAPSTASRTVTFTATDKNAAFNSSVQTVSIAAVNDAPTLTSFTSTVANGNEDSEIVVTFAGLQAQGNEADADGTVTAFVIKVVTSGTLKIGRDALTATAWSAFNNTVDATHQAYWTPALNANGTLNAFTAVAKDNGGLESITPIQAKVSIAAVNDAPTLTSFTSTVANGNEDSEIVVTFAGLQAQGNEADADGTVTAFVIKVVTSGTLKIGTDALTATAWSASNNTVDATHQAYWTPALNANGTLNAFTAVAKDNGGLESITPIQAKVSIAAVNDIPVGIVSITGTAEQGQTLTASNNITDADGMGVVTYTWMSGTNAVATGGSYTLVQSDVGKVITVIAKYTDGQGTLESRSSIPISAVANLNHAPVLTTPATISYTDTQYADNFVTATGTLVGSDVDSPVLTYGITGIGVADNGTTMSISNAYGLLTVTKTTGTYSFAPNSAGIEPLSANTTSTFTVTVSDGFLTVSKPLTIAITQSGITESNSSDVLLNGVGVNHWAGLQGDDTYYVDVAGDVITENVGEGTDIVYSTAASYLLADNVENLVIWGAGVNGTGNALSNYIFGSTGNNIIDGGAGADIMYGDLGSDAYYVDNIGDVTVEIGTDWDVVYSTAASYTLNANIEVLFLVEGANRNGNGNSQDNYLLGNTGNNILDGKGGADVMVGYAGNDTYYVDTVGDLVIENAGEGFDTVNSSINYTLTANVEALVLTGAATQGFGNNLNNTLTGNSANNVLGGGSGADTMIGGAGDDTYYVDNPLDSIIENIGKGLDIVYSTAASYTLADNVESLIIWGAGVNGTGNNQANYIIGNTGNNTLDGGAGNDVLYGDGGADTYIGGLGADSLNLTEATATTDTVRIATGDSLATSDSYDVVTRFTLGTGVFNTTGVDKLDLANTAIASNVTAADGVDSGVIRSHSINNGIISFDDINNYTSPLAISASSNLANVFSYLQTNITGGNTVAFISEGNTFVFQDGGVTDTLVELLGVTATNVNNTGLAADSVWVI